MNHARAFWGRGPSASPFLVAMLAAIAAVGSLSLYCVEQRILPASAAVLLNLPFLGIALWSARRMWRDGMITCEREEALRATLARQEEQNNLEVAQRRRAEVALREAHDSLEIKIAERTRDLEQANERLKDLDRLKSEFLAMMSHELRTPLNSIIGFTGILRQELAGPMNEEQKKQLGMVNSSAKHLLALINNVLDLSRVESGRIEVQWEVFKPSEVIAEVVKDLAPLAQQKSLTLETRIENPDLQLCSDRKICLQILFNLANNAVKFTERGWVRIETRSEARDITFSVSDTGIGIQPQAMARLFDAFRQVEGSAERIYQGTGLGLHLSRQLAALLHGRLRAESEFGAGSRFFFTLPLEPEAPSR